MALQRALLQCGWHVREKESHALVAETWRAASRIYEGPGGVQQTRLLLSPWLSETGNCTVCLKLENEQVLRAGNVALGPACNLAWLLELVLLCGSHSSSAASAGYRLVQSTRCSEQGLAAASSGNHALAFVHACRSLPAQQDGAPVPALVYLPETASPGKVLMLQHQGAQLVLHGHDCIDAEAEASRVASERSMTYVSPYNDLQVAGGQGTIAVELLSVLSKQQLDYVFVPVGGGGLISGIAALLKSVDATIQVIGCQPAASNVMMQSVAAGRVLALPSDDTLSDGTAGGVDEAALTLEPCMRFVDEWVAVSEQEIAVAMLGVLERHSMRVEGAAGVAVAAFQKMAPQLAGKHCVIVVCGGNVSDTMLDRARQLAEPQAIQTPATS